MYLSLFGICCWDHRRFRCMIRIGTGIALSRGHRGEADFSIVRWIRLRNDQSNQRTLFDPLTLVVDVSGLTVVFFSIEIDVANSVRVNCLWFIVISLFRRLTFCPSALSSVFGVRFRRLLSVVDGHFFKVLALETLELFGVTAATVVVVPNNRKGEMLIGWKSASSVSVGLTVFGWSPTTLLMGEARLLLLSTESLRGGKNLNVEKLLSNGRTSWPRDENKDWHM